MMKTAKEHGKKNSSHTHPIIAKIGDPLRGQLCEQWNGIDGCQEPPPNHRSMQKLLIYIDLLPVFLPTVETYYTQNAKAPRKCPKNV